VRPDLPLELREVVSSAELLLRVWRRDGWPFAGFAVQLPNVAGAELSGLVATNSDITWSIENTIVSGMEFRGCVVLDVEMTRCRINDLRFDGGRVDGLVLRECEVMALAFDACSTRAMQLTKCKTRELSIIDSELRGLGVVGGSIRGLACVRSTLTDVSLRECTVSRASALSCSINDLSVSDAKLDRVSVTGGDHRGIQMQRAQLSKMEVTDVAISDFELHTCAVDGAQVNRAREFTNVVLSHCTIANVTGEIASPVVAFAAIECTIDVVRLRLQSLLGALASACRVSTLALSGANPIANASVRRTAVTSAEISNVHLEGRLDLTGSTFVDVRWENVRDDSVRTPT
jgi:uncharacterized protein YjbI with pentapeptide repeats